MSEPLIVEFDLMLEVPFREKNQAKAQGAKPYYENDTFVCWFVPCGLDVRPFEAWWPAQFRQQQGGAPVQPGADDAEKGVGLSELLAQVRSTLQAQHPSAVWVRAEVVNLSGSNHVYLELAEYGDNGQELAKARGTLWASQRGLLRRFEEETGQPLRAGVKILCQAYVEFSERYGFSLHIKDIDTRYTVGDMEAKLLAIRKTLKEQGIYAANRALPPPREFCRVALIAPQGAAGLGDFMTHATTLMEYGLCDFTLFPATFQGQHAAQSVSTALDTVAQAIQNGQCFDAIVIIRGGGDKAGLYALNELDIAWRVCTAPVPVMVGIGHDQDNTLLDELACVRCATPSLVVAQIHGTIVHNAKQAREDWIMLRRLASDTTHRARLECERLNAEMKAAAGQQIQQARTQAERRYQEIRDAAREKLGLARTQVRELMIELMHSNPQTIVQQGYALVRNAEGRVVGNASDLAPGEAVQVQMRDGRFAAHKEGDA